MGSRASVRRPGRRRGWQILALVTVLIAIEICVTCRFSGGC